MLVAVLQIFLSFKLCKMSYFPSLINELKMKSLIMCSSFYICITVVILFFKKCKTVVSLQLYPDGSVLHQSLAFLWRFQTQGPQKRRRLV